MTPIEILYTIGAPVLGTLMAGNIYFIKRLVDKIDTTYEMCIETKQGLAILVVTVNSVAKQVRGSRDRGIPKGN